MKYEIPIFIIGLILGAAIVYFTLGPGSSTGCVTLSNVECKVSTVSAQSEVISGNECVHKKGFLGAINTKCEIVIKNKEAVPAEFKAIFSCSNIDSNTPTLVETASKAISAGAQETYEYTYRTGSDFKCVLSSIVSSDVQKANPQMKSQ